MACRAENGRPSSVASSIPSSLLMKSNPPSTASVAEVSTAVRFDQRRRCSISLTSSGADLEHNPDRGPSFADLGEGLIDPRPPFMFNPGQGSSKAFFGWAGLFGGPVVDQAALHGLLRKVRDLGMSLVSINQQEGRG